MEMINNVIYVEEKDRRRLIFLPMTLWFCFYLTAGIVIFSISKYLYGDYKTIFQFANENLSSVFLFIMFISLFGYYFYLSIKYQKQMSSQLKEFKFVPFSCEDLPPNIIGNFMLWMIISFIIIGFGGIVFFSSIIFNEIKIIYFFSIIISIFGMMLAVIFYGLSLDY